MANGARNFLFAASSDDVALTRLIGTAARVTGFMQGAPGPALPGWYFPAADNGDALRAFHARLAATYPQAGPVYFATRLWTSLIWQPAFLAVIAVHVHGAMPSLASMSQAIRTIDVNGFRLVPGPQKTGDAPTLIAQAGADLRDMAENIFGEINTIARLKHRPAMRLLADRMLGLMIRLKSFDPSVSVSQQLEWCSAWLAAMNLTGEGALEALDLEDGRQVLVMDRKGCCLDYRADPGAYCSSCPKLDRPVRISRLRAEAIAELAD